MGNVTHSSQEIISILKPGIFFPDLQTMGISLLVDAMIELGLVSGVKEDIILNTPQGDEAEYGYKLELPAGTEARLESDGSLGVYGVSTSLLGNVTTSSEKDAELLQKARTNGEKTTLLFKAV